MFRINYVAPLTLLLLGVSNTSHAADAFPGAEGYGKNALGGRNGKVLFVTNLWNSGAGSLRSACEASGRRTVVFRVGGKINLKSPITITNPYITIAGQTAPGGGILLKHKRNPGFTKSLIQIRTHDVIMRHLRLRRGPSAEGEETGDCLFVGKSGSNAVHNIIIDQCSFSWSTDELVDLYYNTRDVTLQNCIFSEALDRSTHVENGEFQAHSMGVFCSSNAKRVTLYRNLFAHNRFRNPWFKSDTSGNKAFQFVNNVIYNYGENGSKYKSSSGTVRVDSKGNRYLPGLDTRTERYEVLIDDGAKLYVKDNRGPNRSSSSQNEWRLVGDFDTKTTPASTSFRSWSSLTANLNGIPTRSASYIVNHLLPRVGATLPARDAVDNRIIQNVWDGDGFIIDHPDDVGGYPAISNGTPDTDSDNDGMPDWWENNKGLNKNKASDRNNDNDSDGYTNLEEYLNDTSPWSAD